MEDFYYKHFSAKDLEKINILINENKELRKKWEKFSTNYYTYMESINKNIDKINIIRGNYHLGPVGYEG